MIESGSLDSTAHKVVCDLLGLDPERPFVVTQDFAEVQVEGRASITGESRVYWPSQSQDG